MTRIHLHLGAHKTATTYIQAILDNNRNVLEYNNIYPLTPSVLRNQNFEKILNTKQPNINWPNTELYLKPDSLSIISEENIIGVPYDFKSSLIMYPRAANRLENLSKLLNKRPVSIFFCIRSYYSFYRSCYLEAVRNRGFFEFTDFYEEKRFANHSWVDLFKVIRNAFPKANITIWCYEDFSSLENTIIKRITEMKNIEVLKKSNSNSSKRISLSAKGLLALKDTKSLNQTSSHSELANTLIEKYPVTKEYPPYMPFTENEIHHLNNRYLDDILTIKNRFPEATFLSVS